MKSPTLASVSLALTSPSKTHYTDYYHRYYLKPQHLCPFSWSSHFSVIGLLLCPYSFISLPPCHPKSIIMVNSCNAYSMLRPIHHSCLACPTFPRFILIFGHSPYGCWRFPLVTLGHYLHRLPYDLWLLMRWLSSR